MSNNGSATLQALFRNDEGHGKEKHEDLPGSIEELQDLLQVEGDRRVTQALKTASEKWQKVLLERIEAEKIEARHLAGLALEKFEKEALERYSRELDCKERALKKKELELKIVCLLAENKLPLELKDFIPDIEETAAIKMVETLIRLWHTKFNLAVNEAVKEILIWLHPKQ